MVLAVLAALAVVVALAADHVSWPMTPAFPWLHGAGEYSYVATKSQWQISTSARLVARFAAVLAVLLVAASVVVGLLRRNRPRRER